MNNFLMIAAIILFFTASSFAQQNQKGSFEVEDGKVIIHYSLDSEPDTEYEIIVLLKRTGISSFEYEPENLTGDIGEGEFTSGNKTIVWHLTEEETEKFDEDDFYFEIRISKKSGGIAWYYYVGTAILGGGAAAVLLLSKKGEDSPSTPATSFPIPPVRP